MDLCWVRGCIVLWFFFFTLFAVDLELGQVLTRTAVVQHHTVSVVFCRSQRLLTFYCFLLLT